MQNIDTDPWKHSHAFGQQVKKKGESRTIWVVIINLVTMVVEIVAGILSGSMALLADGLHMASHAAALTINVFAYRYARKNAFNKSFSFGTGKVNSLAAFASAVLLAVFSLIMAYESVSRFISPLDIRFNEAIYVAIIGLAINLLSAFVLKGKHGHGHEHKHDHNLKSAYLHVITDALTSIFAIVALLVAKYFDQVWLDPLMGVLGAVLVGRWSIGLLKETSRVLLDKQLSQSKIDLVTRKMESIDDTKVADIHLWSLGSGKNGIILSMVTTHPREIAFYESRLPDELSIVHSTIQVNKPVDKSH
ncbi:MAG TPA: cation transporter [Cytophagales bacterium]|jgi:cation diffusion facilitator family transporter|nr:cation transporter [Cytophagales bacterium]